MRGERQNDADVYERIIVGMIGFEFAQQRQSRYRKEASGKLDDGVDGAQPIRVPTKREILLKQRLGVSTSDASAVVQEQHAKRK